MKKAFTLIEEIMIIVLIGILAMVFAVYIREGAAAWHYLSTQKNMALADRAALNRIVREIKRVVVNTDISVHTTTEVAFLDVDAHNVSFSQNGSQLLRNGQVMLDKLADPGGLTFQYLNNTGSATTEVSQISVVVCRIVTVERNNRFALESAAGIRSRRLN
jgi:hypothetical protein